MAMPNLNEIRDRIAYHFPLDATCWSQATDEVRDMCRWAREELNLGYEEAVDFRDIKTPSEWNTKGIEGIMHFYSMMNDEQRGKWISWVNEAFEFHDGSTMFGDIHVS